MDSEEFIKNIPNSEWYKDEKTRNTIILELIEKFNRENIIGEIQIENSLYDKSSSKKNISSLEFNEFFENNEPYYYPVEPNINDEKSDIEKSTGISKTEIKTENQDIVNNIFESFIKIKDYNNDYNTPSMRKNAFQNFMKIVGNNIEYQIK